MEKENNEEKVINIGDIKYLNLERKRLEEDKMYTVTYTHNKTIVDNLLFVYNGNYVYSYLTNQYFGLEDSEKPFIDKIKNVIPSISSCIDEQEKRRKDYVINNLKVLKLGMKNKK